MKIRIEKKAVGRKRKINRKDSRGGIGIGYPLLILIGITILAFFLSGLNYKPPVLNSPSNAAPDSYTCCDTGDGANCQPITTNTISFHSPSYQEGTPQFGTTYEYQLLKSNVAILEPSHLQDSGQIAPDGNHIFYSDSQLTGYNGKQFGTPSDPSSCNTKTHTQDVVGVWDRVNNGLSWCVGFPDDEIVYVCRTTPLSDCLKPEGTGVFDAYFRVADGAVPTVISSCVKPTGTYNLTASPQTISYQNYPSPGKKNLQLETFTASLSAPQQPWMSPFCKPAVYLYPPEKTAVNVQIAPLGKLILTIPTYPDSGWNVTAYPDGKIVEGNSTYDYLFYEASMPDSLLSNPINGYSVAYDKLSDFFQNTLPQLGLNQKEQVQFSEYWLKALPYSPYYFVGVEPESLLNAISPLTITPKPDTTIRVDLYFEPFDHPVSSNPPANLQIKRSGFTVVEWGGLFKKDVQHPFTCLM